MRGLLYSLRMNSLRALLPLAPKGTSFALKYTGLFLSSHEFRMPSPVSCDEARRRVSRAARQRARGGSSGGSSGGGSGGSGRVVRGGTGC